MKSRPEKGVEIFQQSTICRTTAVFSHRGIEVLAASSSDWLASIFDYGRREINVCRTVVFPGSWQEIERFIFHFVRYPPKYWARIWRYRGRLFVDINFTCTVCVFLPKIRATDKNKKLSWWWKPARRVYRWVKVIKHSTIPYVRYSFLLCNSNCVFKTRRFYDIRHQKMSWPWNWGQRSPKVIESDIIR